MRSSALFPLVVMWFLENIYAGVGEWMHHELGLHYSALRGMKIQLIGS
jgi:hypothetical protein